MSVHPPNSFLEAVAQQVATRPKAIAVEEPHSKTTSYSELWSQAQRVCTIVKTTKGRVSIELPQSTDYIASLIGCWMAQQAPVILDPCWPEARKKTIRDEAQVTMRLQSPVAEHTPRTIEKTYLTKAREAAYLIYSSGSSGKPKGVIVPHERLLSLFQEQGQALLANEQSRFFWIHNVAFDASISDLGVALISGSTICIRPMALAEGAKGFLQMMEELSITHIDIPPSLLSLLRPEEAPKSCLLYTSPSPRDRG